jgi:hypothetical protein
MFEITGDDVAHLSDENLRSLVGLLREAEAKRLGYPISSITWSGHQDAADGGVDVRVALPANSEVGGFIPRPATAFQVKKAAMPRQKILAEMRPGGALRPAIRDLADRSGAYIIVSSEGHTSDAPLQDRRAAMREAANDLPNPNALLLDFYDRGRLATWVRDHAGLTLWVREKIGKPIHSWHPYEAWAYDPEGARGEYLLDDKLRILTNTGGPNGELQAAEGIKRIRDRLRKSQSIVRLVGLSGVGKTRLAQALFDERVGTDSLDPALACYTNIADEPEPRPLALAAELIAAKKRAIFVIDNCPPDLHHRLSVVCRAPDSLLSLITVEYDVREDEPEGADVFSLEPSSIELLAKLVKRRVPGLSPVDARTIADFSGGNARVATALAATLGKNETIAGLSDEDLFKRLFQQRNDPNESLLLAAQALSLVYSFQVDNEDASDQVELFTLGSLIGKNLEEMFLHAAELSRRHLLQKRGRWRAVLPHAIANRLATMALQNISPAAIEKRLINGPSKRLLRSFSHRLGYLNKSKEARAIATKWLAPQGLLENIADLDEPGMAMFNYIAPVVPEDALLALEQALLGPNSDEVVAKCKRFVYVLRSLAYEPPVFERCIALIVKIANAGDVDSDTNEARKVFASLFPVYLSGTHATIEQRLATIKTLIVSDDTKRRTIGLLGLKGVLEGSHFGSAYNFEFGARSRDYGYWPHDRDEVKQWFAKSLRFAEIHAGSNQPAASQVRSIIAQQFRGLWTSAAQFDELEGACRAISEMGFWAEGWIAVRQTIHYDSPGFPPEVSARLASLGNLLQPSNLVEKVRSIVLSDTLTYVGIDSDDDRSKDIEATGIRIAAMAQELGATVAADGDALRELLAELVCGHGQRWSFGCGLAMGAEDPKALWDKLVTQLEATPEDSWGIQVFCGFLNGLHATKQELSDSLLDDAMKNAPLALIYPALQTCVEIDKRGVDRLMRSLDLGRAHIRIYRFLNGRATDSISGRDLSALILEVARTSEGLDAAIDILYARIISDNGQHRSSAPEVVDAGRELIRKLDFTRWKKHQDYRWGAISNACLLGEEGASVVQEMSRKLREAISKYETYTFHHEDLLSALFSVQPIAALDGLCPTDMKESDLSARILEEVSRLRMSPFHLISAEVLLGWGDQDPTSRYPLLATFIPISQPSADTGEPEWTSVARLLLDKAPDRIQVLKNFLTQLDPIAWFGNSRASIVKSNEKLLDDLADYPDPAVVEFIREQKTRLAAVVKDYSHIDDMIARETDERFE